MTETRRDATLPIFLIWIALAGFVVVADQYTKTLIIAGFQIGEAKVVWTDLFNLVRVHNSGAAFSFMASADGWQRWLFTGIGLAAAAGITALLKFQGGQKLFGFALACILGGALGNVLDRIMYGYVIDFLDFYWGSWHFPAFNLADSAITLGAFCLVCDEFLRGKSPST